MAGSSSLAVRSRTALPMSQVLSTLEMATNATRHKAMLAMSLRWMGRLRKNDGIMHDFGGMLAVRRLEECRSDGWISARRPPALRHASPFSELPFSGQAPSIEQKSRGVRQRYRAHEEVFRARLAHRVA